MEFTCGMCHHQVKMGASVCTACQGTVIYGATRREKIFFGVIGIYFGIAAYQSLAHLFGSVGGGTPILFAAAFGAALGVLAIGKIRAKKIRTFRYLAR